MIRLLLLSLLLSHALVGQTHQQAISNLRKSLSTSPAEKGWVHYVTPEQERIDAEVVKFSTKHSFNGTILSNHSETPARAYVQTQKETKESTELAPSFMDVTQSLQGYNPWRLTPGKPHEN